MAGRGQAGFTATTRRLLGDRAGWRCSVPGCHALTVGPGDAPHETAQVGTAAHIHSAALTGPRGRGGLTDVQLADASNGIWCCAAHGREIDTNSGRGYAVETLRGWKQAREEAARRERTGFSAPGAGWIDKITLRESPRFASGSVLTLGKGTVLESDGSIGKSSLYEWIAAAGGHALAERWREQKIRLEVRYASPLPHRLEYTSDSGKPGYILDGAIIHVPPPDFQVVYIRERALRRTGIDDLNELATALSAEPSITRSLAEEIARNGSDFLSALRFMEEVPEDDEVEKDEETTTQTSLYVTRASTGHEQSYRSLSTSEQFKVLIEFAAALARERARTAPTLLLVDAGGWNLTEGNWALVAQFLLAQPFQSVITPNYIGFDDPIWQSWSHVRLGREERGGSIPTTVIPA